MSTHRVRPAAIAGTWYAGEAETLARDVDRMLGEAGPPDPSASPGSADRPIALIAPHAGLRYSGPCAGRAYRLLRGLPIERIVILGPSHYAHFEGVSLPDVDAFATPLGEVPIDREACEALLEDPLVERRPDAHEQEHAIEIQLPFLQRACPGFRLVPLLVGKLEGEAVNRLADRLRELRSPGTVLVVSSDLTHYGVSFGYVPFHDDVPQRLRELDRGAIDRILARDAEGLASYHAETGITACGLRPIYALLHTLPPDAWGELVQYTTSGDISGDWEHVVSYASIAFHAPTSAGGGEAAAGAPSLSVEGRACLLRRARSVIEGALGVARESEETGETPSGVSLVPGGVFVTLNVGGELRGCIGAMEPDRPLWKVVEEQALRSAFHDPRFLPLKAAELEMLRIEISVLEPPVRVAGPEAFQPGSHGIVMEKDGRRAVFLPQVARDHGWSREETLKRLTEKAGLPPGAWREGASFWIFRAQVFGEDEGTAGEPAV